jgi:hypothetical protein
LVPVASALIRVVVPGRAPVEDRPALPNRRKGAHVDLNLGDVPGLGGEKLDEYLVA